MSADLKRLARRVYEGDLTLENLWPVAHRLRTLIGDGQHYTSVYLNSDLHRGVPEVRTGCSTREVKAGVDGVRGWMTFSDGSNTHLIDTRAVDQAAARSMPDTERTKICFTGQQFVLIHYAPAGNKEISVLALEDR